MSLKRHMTVQVNANSKIPFSFFGCAVPVQSLDSNTSVVKLNVIPILRNAVFLTR